MKAHWLLPALVTLAPFSALAQATPTSSAAAAAPKAPSSSPPQAEIAAVTDDRLVIQAPKWQRAGEENSGLDVQFRWDPKAEFRAAVTKDAGTTWVVTFPDRPPAGVEADVQFTYHFTLGKAGQEELREDAVKAAATTLQALAGALHEANAAAKAAQPDGKQAARESKWNDEIKSRLIATIQPALKPLTEFATKNGTGADSVLLTALGFAQGADGTWTLSIDALEGASDVSSLLKALEAAQEGALSTKATVDSLTGDGFDAGCKTAVQSLQKTASASTGLAAVEACADAISGAAPAANKADVASAVDALKARAKLLAVGAFDSPSAALGADTDANNALGQLKTFKDTPNFKSILFAKNAILLSRLQELQGKLEDQLAAEVVERRVKLERDDVSNAYLELEARRRWYDASTGIVYLGGLDDFIVPTLLSVCPFGCMKLDHGTEDYWVSPHVLSVDFGLKAATLDKHVDPRQEDRLGMLVGLSYNPIDVVRLSGGAYIFENRQTNNTNVTGYVGVTVNVLHAAELLGAIGVTSIPKATLKPKAEDDSPAAGTTP